MKKTRIYIIVFLLIITIIGSGCSHKHKYVETEVIDPTCIAQGYSIFQCECNDFYKENFTEPLGHIEVADERREPTCSLPGLTVGSHCSRCNMIITKQDEIPCLEHQLGGFVMDKEPTEDEHGQISKHCVMCNQQFEIQVIEYEPSVLTYELNESKNGYIITGFIEDLFHKSDFTIPSIHQSLEVIGIKERAFANCKLLEEVYIPNSIALIGDGAFAGCSNLKSVRFPKNMTKLGNEIFMSCTSLVEIKLTEFLTEMGDKIFYNCVSLKKVIMPETVSKIGESAFFNCISLETFTIPQALTEISANLFEGCLNLQTVEMHDNITEIGDSAFSNCKKFKIITLPKQLQVIGDSAFANCSSLMMINLLENVNAIGSYSFSGCTMLESIIVPAGVEKMGESVFLNSPYTVIICDDKEQPSTWNANWNSSNNAVYWAE